MLRLGDGGVAPKRGQVEVAALGATQRLRLEIFKRHYR